MTPLTISPHNSGKGRHLLERKVLAQTKSHKCKAPQRNHGAATGLVIVSTFLLIICIVGLFQLSMIMGGSRQVRNAVDAGVLNISKRIIEVKVPANPQYKDVADSTGNVGISNINRIWGKAYLVNANAESMKADGQAGSNTETAAEAAFGHAKNLNDMLFNKVSDENVLNMYFQQLAHQRQASMVKANKVEKSQADTISIAMIDRGLESNLSYTNGQLPDRITAQGTTFGNKSYLKGYVPMQANNHQFSFTSFRQGEMPHLIDDTYFENNSAAKPIGGAYTPLPNAFKRHGEVDSMSGKLTAVACAAANPQRTYTLAIPYSFVTIQVGNTAKWHVDQKKIKETTYGFKPEEQKGIKDYPLPSGGMLYGNASLGNEYSAATTLLEVIEALPGDHNQAFKKLLQRIKEIDPDFNQEKLYKLLQSAAFNKEEAPASSGTAQPRKYFIYPVYSSADNTDPTIKIGSDKQNLPSWLNPDNPPEGLDKTVIQETKQKDKPNYCWGYVVGGKSSSVKHYTEVYGDVLWQPGTGFGQHLGELRFARVTDIYFVDEPDSGP